MVDTADFKTWLDSQDLDGDMEGLICLYRAVTQRASYSNWKVTTQGDMTFISGSEGALQLFTEKARQAFIKHLDHLPGYGDAGLSVESKYDIYRNSQKND